MFYKIEEKIGLQGIRWLSFLLAVLALWMLWKNWFMLTGDTKAEFQESLRYAGSITSIASDLADNLEFSGLSLSVAQAKKVVKAVQDGGLSIAEGSSLLAIGAKAALAVGDSEIGSLMDNKTKAIFEQVLVVNFFYQLLFWVTIISTLWAAIQRILKRNDKVAQILFPILYCSLYAILLILWSMISLKTEGEFAVSVTAWSILAPFCALFSAWLWTKCYEKLLSGATDSAFGALNVGALSGGVSVIVEKGRELAEKGACMLQSTPQKPWVCPTCSTEMEKDKRFCTQCGAKRPEPQHCAVCGALQEPGIVFCSNCGQKFVPQQKCEKCDAVIKPGEKFCSVCGAPQTTRQPVELE